MCKNFKKTAPPTIALICGITLITAILATSSARAAVLWDQPLSTINQNGYVNQDFPDYPTYSSYIADDFVNGDPWDISTIFVPGSGWNGFSSLSAATSLNFAIYTDSSGIPGATPPTGGAWNISLAPTDAQISITTGSDGYLSNVTLNLTTAINLAAGHWWFVFWPEMNFASGGQYGRQASDTTNGYTAQFINPGDGFGYGTTWRDWTVLGQAQTDLAFRLEGTQGGNNVVPEPATMLLMGIGLAGTALIRRHRKTEM
jgi:hypothetical protein